MFWSLIYYKINTRVEVWSTNNKYLKLKKTITSIPVANDAAEKVIKLAYLWLFGLHDVRLQWFN